MSTLQELDEELEALDSEIDALVERRTVLYHAHRKSPAQLEELGELESDLRRLRRDRQDLQEHRAAVRRKGNPGGDALPFLRAFYKVAKARLRSDDFSALVTLASESM